jgi:hypothetical protein
MRQFSLIMDNFSDGIFLRKEDRTVMYHPAELVPDVPLSTPRPAYA